MPVHKVRIAAANNRFQSPVSTDNSTIKIWRGTSVRFEIALYDGDALADISTISSLTLAIKDLSSTGGAPDPSDPAIIYKQITYDEMNADLTEEDWDAYAGQHAVMDFTDSELNVARGTKWFVLSAVTGATPQERVTFAAGRIEIVEDGTGANTSTPPEPLDSYYTASESDARFLTHVEVDQKDAALKDEILGGVGPAYDTLQEIHAFIQQSDTDTATALTASIDTKLNKDGSNLTDNDRSSLKSALQIDSYAEVEAFLSDRLISQFPTKTPGHPGAVDFQLLQNRRGEVKASGYNGYGSLGVGTSYDVFRFRNSGFIQGNQAIDGLENGLNRGQDSVIKMVTSRRNSYVLTAKGYVYATGDGASGSNGQGDTSTPLIFKSIRFGSTSSENKRITDIFIGSGPSGLTRSACFAIDEDGYPWCWGDNSLRQMGIGDLGHQYNPIKLTESHIPQLASKTIKKIVTTPSQQFTFILFTDGTLMFAGNGTWGASGLGDQSQHKEFTEVTGLGTVVDVWGYSASSNFGRNWSYIQDSEGKIYGAGFGGFHAFGIPGDTSDKYTFTEIPNLGPVDYFTFVGQQPACFAVKPDGTIHSWGYNGGSILGVGSTVAQDSIQTPQRLNELASSHGGVKKIDYAGSDTNTTVYVLFNDGVVATIGKNQSYQCGVGHASDLTEFEIMIDSDPSSKTIDIMAVGSNGSNSSFFMLKENARCYVCGHAAVGTGESNQSSHIGVPTLVNI